jgi:hypothetical protein
MGEVAQFLAGLTKTTAQDLAKVNRNTSIEIQG